MTIELKTLSRKNPITKDVAYYANIVSQQPLERADLLDRIEKRSTLSSADIKGALDAIEYEIKQALLEGRTIRLGDLGSFHLTVTTKGVEKANQWQPAQHILGTKVRFIPSASLRKAVQPAPIGQAKFKVRTSK